MMVEYYETPPPNTTCHKANTTCHKANPQAQWSQ